MALKMRWAAGLILEKSRKSSALSIDCQWFSPVAPGWKTTTLSMKNLKKSFISMLAPDNYFHILKRKCKTALSDERRKEKRDDAAMTGSAEALVFPGWGGNNRMSLTGPRGLQPWHPPARPARAAGAPLLQPSPQSSWLVL